jgi:hypothetical protein
VRLHRASASLLRQSRKLNSSCTSTRASIVKHVTAGASAEAAAEEHLWPIASGNAFKGRAEVKC